MNLLLVKILILIPILVLLGILIYSKINESFDSSNPGFEIMRDTISNPNELLPPPNNTTTTFANQLQPTTTFGQTISTQLTSQLADKLGISIRRIQSLDFTGDLANHTLAVTFTILEPNIIETSKGEPNAASAANIANTLFTSNQFTVDINGDTITLTKINTDTNTSTASKELSDFFNNKALLDSAAYARKVYDAVPMDESATKFFILKPDRNFNLVPVLQ